MFGLVLTFVGLASTKVELALAQFGLVSATLGPASTYLRLALTELGLASTKWADEADESIACVSGAHLRGPLTMYLGGLAAHLAALPTIIVNPP